jgi:putative tricarboxylic transport membrane protein
LLLLTPAAVFADPLLDRLLIVAPAAPGGGWDQTGRAVQHALEREGLVRIVEVQNVAGAAGTIGLAQFVDAQRGNGAAVLVTGLVMLGATIWNESPVSLGQVTPIARLTGEYEVVAVPAGSPYRDMRGLVEALRASPDEITWGGGSAGGTDHILAGLVASAAGVDPRRVNYIAFSGGGEAVAALIGGNVTAGVSGYSEFAPHIESGRLRALAISAPSRLSGIDVPTLLEQDLDVELANWRGVVAPPGISQEARDRLTVIVRRMTQSATWRHVLADRGWTNAYADGAAFGRYLDSERIRIARIVSRLRPPGGEASRMGQRIFPAMVFTGGAVVCLMLLRQRPARAIRSHASNTRAVTMVGAALFAFPVLLEPLGFVLAASLMFAVVASASFGLAEASPSRSGSFRVASGGAGFSRPMRLFGIGLLFSLAVYLAFTRGLDLALPYGAIWSWIR